MLKERKYQGQGQNLEKVSRPRPMSEARCQCQIFGLEALTSLVLRPTNHCYNFLAISTAKLVIKLKQNKTKKNRCSYQEERAAHQFEWDHSQVHQLLNLSQVEMWLSHHTVSYCTLIYYITSTHLWFVIYRLTLLYIALPCVTAVVCPAHAKHRGTGLFYNENRTTLASVVLSQYTRVTDRSDRQQTDDILRQQLNFTMFS